MSFINFNSSTGIFEVRGSFRERAFVDTVDCGIINGAEVNSCVMMADYSALVINSTYNKLLFNRDMPYIDGVVLKAVAPGGITQVANQKGQKYTTSESLGKDESVILWLSQSGKLTTVTPSLDNGDKWAVAVARRVNEYNFIFDPQFPVDLTSLSPGEPIPTPVPKVDDDKVILGEPLPAMSPFMVKGNNYAYKITANDDTIAIDGITLESGGIGQEVKCGRISNYEYKSTLYFTTHQNYFLSDVGSITPIFPSGCKWCIVIGRSVENSSTFIFNPQLPLRLL